MHSPHQPKTKLPSLGSKEGSWGFLNWISIISKYPKAKKPSSLEEFSLPF